jgi:hypothetical protein
MMHQGESGTWLRVMVLAMGVVPGVMVPGECGTWLGVMELVGCDTWCDALGECGT